MDPLSIVRDYALAGKAEQISVVGENVLFGSQYKFAKSSFTAFRGQRDFATLELVLNVLRTKDLPHTEYLKQASAARLEPLTFIDRKVQPAVPCRQRHHAGTGCGLRGMAPHTRRPARLSSPCCPQKLLDILSGKAKFDQEAAPLPAAADADGAEPASKRARLGAAPQGAHVAAQQCRSRAVSSSA